MVTFPKEETYLFAALLMRRPDSAPLVEALCEEHAAGVERLDGLAAALEAYRADPAGFARFREAAGVYVNFERDHMNREERELMPLALEVLEDADWRAMDASL